MASKINVAIVGTKFMGHAHSNAFIGEKKRTDPDFYDGLRCQQVLDAVVQSSATGKWVEIPAGE